MHRATVDTRPADSQLIPNKCGFPLMPISDFRGMDGVCESFISSQARPDKMRAERIAPLGPLPTGKRGGKPRLASFIVRNFK